MRCVINNELFHLLMVSYSTEIFTAFVYSFYIKGGINTMKANNKQQLSRRTPSKRMQAARRAGIDIEVPQPHLPVMEQEQADIS